MYYLGGEVHVDYRTTAVDERREIPISDVKKRPGQKRIAALSDGERMYLEKFTA